MYESYNKIAVFDLDGTIVETDDAVNASYACAFERVGLGIKVAGRLMMGVVRQHLPRISNAELAVLAHLKDESYAKQLCRSLLGPAATALRKIVNGTSPFGKLVLLTDSKERRAMETLRHHGLLGFFDEIVCNGGQGDKYANYFKNYDSDPAACVVWENESEKIKSAIAAGVKAENARKVG